MARPARYNAEYFTHPAGFRNDRRVKAIRTQMGASGYGLLMMLLEALTDADYTELNTEDLEVELLAGDFGVSATEIHSLLQAAEKFGLFTRNEAGNLICPELNKWLEPVFEKRNRARNTAKPDSKQVTVTETPVTVTENPQSKVKESRVKESISKHPLTPSGEGGASKKIDPVSAGEELPSDSLSLTSANSGGAAPDEEPLKAEAHALATEIALNWQISEQRNFQKWAKIFRFCRLLAQAGQLGEARRQFVAYHDYRLLRGISSYNLDKYLGHETNLSPDGWPYADGEWCGCDWPSTLAEARHAAIQKATARPVFGPPPTATAVAGNYAAPTESKKIR